MKIFTYSSRGNKNTGPRHHIAIVADTQKEADAILNNNLPKDHVLRGTRVVKEEFEIKKGIAILFPA